ncbi:hypothetical protein HMPREF3204_00631 [Gardnerella pickettii]|nr:hypothetical protein HMPREF3204_00631 [Gardnerella pickettii]
MLSVLLSVLFATRGIQSRKLFCYLSLQKRPVAKSYSKSL